MIRLTNLPLDNIAITSDFGLRKIVVNSKTYWWHNGIDLKAKTGDKVYAVADGIVQVAKDNPGGYGLYAVINHNCFGSLYAHLSELKVDVGQKVESGDLIGYSGNTGASTGPHLHFEIRECDYKDFWTRCAVDSQVFMRCVDPAPYLNMVKQRSIMTKADAIKIVQEKCGFEDSTMLFLDCYKYAEPLFVKLAKVML